MGDQAEPILGDIGELEVEKFDDDEKDDSETKREIGEEDSNLDIRDPVLEKLVQESQIKLTDSEMREAESEYKVIEEATD